MKRIPVLILTAVLSMTMLLTGCGLGSTDREGELDTIYEDTYSQISETFSESGSKFTMVEEYIKSWAKTNGIKVTKMTENYMVLRNAATEGLKDAETVTLQCPVDTSDMITSGHILSTALASLLGPEEHGTVKLIITESTPEDFRGAEAVPAEYLKTANLINLRDSGKADLKSAGAYAFDATLYRGVGHETPTHSNAYEISMNIGSYRDSFDYGNKYPDPIEVVGDYLATGKSSGYLFQLASFNSKVSAGGTPESASAVIVIDDNNVEKMQKKFDKAYDKLKKKCEKLGVDFVFTMTETSMPSQVIDDLAASRLISMLYTIDPGVFYQDEDSGDIVSAEEFVQVETQDNKFLLRVTGRSKTKAGLEDMKQALITTAGLSDVKYNINREYMTWSSKDSTASYFAEALALDEDAEISTLRTSELNILASKRPSLSCISYGFTLADDKTAVANLIGFLAHVAGTDE